MSLKLGNIFVTCPYNSSHQVAKTKLDHHLDKCRRNYRMSVKNKKREVTELPCKHNPNEIINAPEILFHESRCPHQKIPNYLFMGLKDVKVTKHGVDTFPFADVTWPDPAEDTTLYEYSFVGQTIGTTTRGVAIDVATSEIH